MLWLRYHRLPLGAMIWLNPLPLAYNGHHHRESPDIPSGRGQQDGSEQLRATPHGNHARSHRTLAAGDSTAPPLRSHVGRASSGAAPGGWRAPLRTGQRGARSRPRTAGTPVGDPPRHVGGAQAEDRPGWPGRGLLAPARRRFPGGGLDRTPTRDRLLPSVGRAVDAATGHARGGGGSTAKRGLDQPPAAARSRLPAPGATAHAGGIRRAGAGRPCAGPTAGRAAAPPAGQPADQRHRARSAADHAPAAHRLGAPSRGRRDARRHSDPPRRAGPHRAGRRGSGPAGGGRHEPAGALPAGPGFGTRRRAADDPSGHPPRARAGERAARQHRLRARPVRAAARVAAAHLGGHQRLPRTGGLPAHRRRHPPAHQPAHGPGHAGPSTHRHGVAPERPPDAAPDRGAPAASRPAG